MKFRTILRQWGLNHCPALYDFYSECVRRRLPDQAMVCDGPGFKINITSPRENVIDRAIYRTGVWEPEMTSMAIEKIQPGWHILDVGAHIGYYTLLFGKQCGPQGRVAAFEPEMDAFKALNANIELNGMENIRTFRLALSDHRGHVVMKPENRGLMLADKEGDAETTAEMIPSDEFWPTLDWPKVDLVKIDVEGAELGVLTGMENMLRKYHPHLFVEIHPLHLKKCFHSSADEVLCFLKEKHHYKLVPVDSDSLQIHDDNVTIWGD